MKRLVALIVVLMPGSVLSQESAYYSEIPVFTGNDGSVSHEPVSVLAVDSPDNYFRLLQNPRVQNELELFDHQKAELLAAVIPLFNDLQQKKYQLRKGADGATRHSKEMKELDCAFHEAAWNATTEVLVPRQLRRLRQIQFQAELDADYTQAVQTGKLSDLLEMTDEQERELQRKSADAKEKLDREIKELIAKRHREVLEAVLTKRQLVLLDESLGKPMAEGSK